MSGNSDKMMRYMHVLEPCLYILSILLFVGDYVNYSATKIFVNFQHGISQKSQIHFLPYQNLPNIFKQILPDNMQQMRIRLPLDHKVIFKATLQ